MLPDQNAFARRTFSAGEFFAALGWLLVHLPRVLRVHGGRRGAPPPLREAIWLAVTEVNGCRYCAFVHGGMAGASGLTDADIDLLLRSSDPAALERIETLPPEARRLVAWTKAWAEARRTGAGAPPTPRDAPLDGDDLEALLRAVEFGNLSGNTLDSLLHRFSHPRRLLDPVGLASDGLVGLLVAAFGWPAVLAGALARLCRRGTPASR